MCHYTAGSVVWARQTVRNFKRKVLEPKSCTKAAFLNRRVVADFKRIVGLVQNDI